MDIPTASLLWLRNLHLEEALTYTYMHIWSSIPTPSRRHVISHIDNAVSTRVGKHLYTGACSPIPTCGRMCSCRGHWSGSAHGYHDTCYSLRWYTSYNPWTYIYFSPFRSGGGARGVHYDMSIKHVMLCYGCESWPTRTYLQVPTGCVDRRLTILESIDHELGWEMMMVVMMMVMMMMMMGFEGDDDNDDDEEDEEENDDDDGRDDETDDETETSSGHEQAMAPGRNSTPFFGGVVGVGVVEGPYVSMIKMTYMICLTSDTKTSSLYIRKQKRKKWNTRHIWYIWNTWCIWYHWNVWCMWYTCKCFLWYLSLFMNVILCINK